MDFRINWLAHYRAVVEAEQKRHGSLPKAYTAVSQAIEMKYETVYQHYKQKSGKVYPTVEMMVMIEKKYGNGRPPGWTTQPIDGSEAAPVLSVRTVVNQLAAALAGASDDSREAAGSLLATLAKNPGNAQTLNLLSALLSAAVPDEDLEHLSAAAKTTEMAHSGKRNSA